MSFLSIWCSDSYSFQFGSLLILVKLGFILSVAPFFIVDKWNNWNTIVTSGLFHYPNHWPFFSLWAKLLDLIWIRAIISTWESETQDPIIRGMIWIVLLPKSSTLLCKEVALIPHIVAGSLPTNLQALSLYTSVLSIRMPGLPLNIVTPPDTK